MPGGSSGEAHVTVDQFMAQNWVVITLAAFAIGVLLELGVIGFLRRKGKVPLKRHGTESEIAGAIVYLLSPAAAYVTGIPLRVDGGLHNNARSNFYEVPDHERSTPFNGFPLYRVPDVLKR